MLVEKLKGYSAISKFGHCYVVRSLYRNHAEFNDPNFMGTEMALRGILKRNETLLKFIKRDRLKELRPMRKDC